MSESGEVKDIYNRPLRDLRISVTDRCNFRCRYCMPAEVFGQGYEFLPREEILRFGEIETVAKLLIGLGIEKLRITGGEPLLRRDLPVLLERLAKLDGVKDMAMTTNAVLLKRHAQAVYDAGLNRVTVSLDALDVEIFGQMNGVGAKPEKVIEGIDEALKVGLGVKVNAVIKKGVIENPVVPLVEFAKERGIPMRFIEYMDTGNTNNWKLDEVVPSVELLKTLQAELPLEALPVRHIGETAVRYGMEGVEGFEVGFISSVTKPFCSNCNRMRLSAEGKLYACLFAASGLDVKELLRAGRLEDIEILVKDFWSRRDDRYSVLRAEGVTVQKQEMSYMGG